jgi:2-dehydropantoate 2-reductase
VYGDPADAARERWDLIFLCVASTALREDLLPRIAPAVGAATVVSLGMGTGDVEVLSQLVLAEQIVTVLPKVLAWEGPLTAEIPAAGIAYWAPPLTALDVSGSPARAAAVVEALRRGGIGARLELRASADGDRLAALAIPYVAALELAGWSLRSLRRGPLLELAGDAARQAGPVIATRPRVGLAERLVFTPGGVRLMLRLLPWLVPFDLERYLAQHFAKVGPQTRLMLRLWASRGERRSLPVGAVARLAALLS